MNANQAPVATLARVPTIRAYIAAAAETDPTPEDESQVWIPVSIERTAGFARPDTIVLAKRQTARILDRQLHTAATRRVEVWRLDDEGNRLAPLGWGETIGQQLAILHTGVEQEELVAQIHRYHLGRTDLTGPVNGLRVWDETAQEVDTLHMDVVVNPRVDDETIGNRGREVENSAGAEDSHYVFLHHEAARTDQAALEHNATSDGIPGEWTLVELIDHLVWEFNGEEREIENPRLRTVDARVPTMFDDAPPPDGEVIKRGTWLSEALDNLLPKYGFNCRVDVAAAEDEEDPDLVVMTRKLVIFPRARGPQKALRLQEPGSAVDPARSHLSDTTLALDLSGLANTVRGHGSLIQREVTVPLSPAWDIQHDGDAADLYTVDAAGYRADPDVFRKFVLDTAGDYKEFRPEFGAAAVDLSTLGEGFELPRRRPLGPPLTQAIAAPEATWAARRSPKLEWRETATAEWKEVDFDWEVLKDECGVYIREHAIPSGLVDNDDAELRVTGTLTGDLCVEARIANPQTGPHALDVELFLDLSDRFHDRRRQTTGDYASVLTGEADTRDDVVELTEYLEQIREVEDAVQITARLVLFSLRHAYEIGDVITEIDGRRITLSRTTAGAAAPKYLQVVGVRWDLQQLTTTLTVEPFDVIVS